MFPEVTKQMMANAIRALAMDAVEKANSGHPGMPMGMADVATILFTEFLKFDANEPGWADRDRFILSAGHGSMLLYALLYLTGYKDMTLEQLKNFRQLGSKTAGHPEYGYAKGIETTTGPLGQGLGNAVGMAMAEKWLAARFGEQVNHHTYVIAGDGCLMEGIAQEAISLAGHLKLNKLVVLFDDNQISIDGPTSLSTSEDQRKRFEACGWNTMAIDGHNYDEIRAGLQKALKSDKPVMIACRTIIGFGAPTKAGTAATHGAPLGAEEIKGTREKLVWAHEPFVIPDDILAEWRKAGSRYHDAYKAWEKNASAELKQQLKNDLKIDSAIEALKSSIIAKAPKLATRQCSGNTIEAIAPFIPQLLGGSADLTGSNNTKAKQQLPVKPDNFAGQYIHYGIREHGMCAAMNGMALHGGVIPYGGTFFAFTDYCKPSIRLAALMHQRVIFIMTHDSIGLGEDGPTHQPVEHLAALRAMPNILVMRPMDGVETAECWQIALESTTRPSVLVLTRQALPTLRKEDVKENLSGKGAYMLSPSPLKQEEVTLIATGSEVEIAIQAQALLQQQNIGARVVSMPSQELFNEQPANYREKILPKRHLNVAIEAASSFGWERYIGRDGIFIGMESFGESAPAEALYKHFGITAENVVEKVMARLAKGKVA